MLPLSRGCLLLDVDPNNETDCRMELYGMMRKCWNANIKTRPTFEEIERELTGEWKEQE